MPTAIIIDCSQPDAEPEIVQVPALPFADQKAAKIDAIRALRWQRENAGTLVSGIPIRTDETSQGKISGAVQLFDKDPTLTAIDFEAQPGVWVSLSKAQMGAIGIAAGRHIQACFTRSKDLMAAVTAAANQAQLDAIDITAGWP